MKKKMALLLVFAMIVTSTITMPFVSFADTTTTAKEITTVYGVETEVKTTATKATTTDGVTYSAEYTYTPAWNSNIVLDAAKLAGANDAKADPVIKVTYTNGTDETAQVNPTDKKYALTKGVKYSISLAYTFIDKDKPATDPTELTLKVKAVTETLTIGTAETQSLAELENKEVWYEVAVDAANGKGVVFSLVSGDASATAATKIDYSAEIYNNTKKLLGTSAWNETNSVMYECPLILSTGTYYVKVAPKAATTTKATLKLDTTQVSEVNAFDDAPSWAVPSLLSKDLTLYSFQNAQLSGYWYKIVPTIASGQKARYEMSFDFGEHQYGDVAVDLYDGGLYPIEDACGLAYAENEINQFFADFYSGEVYYLRLTPEIESPKITVKATIKPHTCESAWFVSEDRGDDYEIAYGCPCGAEESLKATCILGVKFNNITYTGTDVTPVPVLVMSDEWHVEGELMPSGNLAGCYTVSFKNGKGQTVTTVTDIGSYTATIKFCKDPNSKNNLEGLDDLVKTVKVVPAGTTLKSITAGKKALTVKWNKKTAKTTGYQIQYSTSSTFKSAKTVTITKTSTTSKKISKLKAKKKYYVRIRTYKTVKDAAGTNVKYYSAWSKSMSKKTK